MALFNDPDTLEVMNEATTSEGTIWKYVSILQLGVIAYLSYKLYQKKPTPQFKNVDKETVKEAANQEFDMENVVNSINKAKPLFKGLSKKCHPDKFANSDKHDKALIIYQKITENKRNHSKLLELKKMAEEELEIKISD